MPGSEAPVPQNEQPPPPSVAAPSKSPQRQSVAQDRKVRAAGQASARNRRSRGGRGARSSLNWLQRRKGSSAQLSHHRKQQQPVKKVAAPSGTRALGGASALGGAHSRELTEDVFGSKANATTYALSQPLHSVQMGELSASQQPVHSVHLGELSAGQQPSEQSVHLGELPAPDKQSRAVSGSLFHSSVGILNTPAVSNAFGNALDGVGGFTVKIASIKPQLCACSQSPLAVCAVSAQSAAAHSAHIPVSSSPPPHSYTVIQPLQLEFVNAIGGEGQIKESSSSGGKFNDRRRSPVQ